ncbi:MAG: ribose-phosphate pyrophosphokinase-like domain-containing protein, partial [Oscillospiraceae bacterium]|nr:ribose-phosphate pyrophosphokinase-like domain-containing protein [Oscillospiraceae bacterium]
MDAETIFHTGNTFPKLGLIVTEGAKELGSKIDYWLTKWAANGPEARDTFIVKSACPRFASGDGKGVIAESVRGMDLFFLLDVGNYNMKYTIFG